MGKVSQNCSSDTWELLWGLKLKKNVSINWLICFGIFLESLISDIFVYVFAVGTKFFCWWLLLIFETTLLVFFNKSFHNFLYIFSFPLYMILHSTVSLFFSQFNSLTSPLCSDVILCYHMCCFQVFSTIKVLCTFYAKSNTHYHMACNDIDDGYWCSGACRYFLFKRKMTMSVHYDKFVFEDFSPILKFKYDISGNGFGWPFSLEMDLLPLLFLLITHTFYYFCIALCNYFSP